MAYDPKRNGHRIRVLRGIRGQKEIAKALGISVQLYGMYERGVRNPPDNMKILFAKFFGVSVENLFYAE